MGIVARIAVVGGAPVAIAAIIAGIAWLLLAEAERIRGAAILAGASHRNLIVATAARNDFINAPLGRRSAHADRFDAYTEAARRDLAELAGRARDTLQEDAIARARTALRDYAERMRAFVALTTENDRLAADMLAQTSRLTAITEEARLRQHSANLDLAAALRDTDRMLRAGLRIVEATRNLREALFVLRLEEPARPGTAATGEEKATRRLVAWRRLAETARTLTGLLVEDGQDRDADRIGSLFAAYENASAQASGTGSNAEAAPAVPAIDAATFRLLKIRSTGRSATEDEQTELIRHLADANATNHAVQNVAVRTLELARRAAAAIDRGDADGAAALLADSRPLAEVVRTVPISPLIQADVVAAVDRWREGLELIAGGLRRQSQAVQQMDRVAIAITDTASHLDRMFQQDAERVGNLLRSILAIGATIGLLLGGGGALVVARSITRPITRLRHATVRLADNPLAGGIPEVTRRDELGDMARAIAFYSAELGRRERDLREAKDAADAALSSLQQAKNDLVQAEKLASLGQLVAGVAHEINTPLGVALTGISHLEDEILRVEETAAQQRLRKADFERYIAVARETARIAHLNLGRAADLIQSFKLVAADQVSEERRQFELGAYLEEVAASLAPTWKKANHTLTLHRGPAIPIDGWPGAMAQVISNLVMNSVIHGFEDGRKGHIDIYLSQPAPDRVELIYTDNGRGIPPETRAKIFDPFFTTRRAQGSTGLGMHIVFNLVTATLRGRIELEANEPHGVRFTIRFPPSPPPDHPPEARTAAAG